MPESDLPIFNTREELEAFLREHLSDEDPPPPNRDQVCHWIDQELRHLDMDELSFFHELLVILRHPSPAGLYHLAQEVKDRMERYLDRAGSGEEGAEGETE